MKKTNYLAFSLMLLALFALPLKAADEGAKVVYHVDFSDVTRYSATLTSINNIMNAYENELMDADVHLVLVGHGLRFATDDGLKGTPYEHDAAMLERRDELKGRLDSLMNSRGVKVKLCDHTRNEINLDPAKIYDGIELVGSGVFDIAILQSQGYAYLKIQ
jgi:intracellular sulfur oxidation DsrE/DsrF family protein